MTSMAKNYIIAFLIACCFSPCSFAESPKIHSSAPFILFEILEPVPADIIQWHSDNAKTLYVKAGTPPYLYLEGTIAKNYKLALEDKNIKVDVERFRFALPLPFESTTTSLYLTDPNGKKSTHRLLTHWKKMPEGLTGTMNPIAFVQLYEGNNPTQNFKMDGSKSLRFRILTSSPESFDRWTLIIKNSANKTIAVVGGKTGSPPSYLNWNEISSELKAREIYTYQVDLTLKGKLYPGKPNFFGVQTEPPKAQIPEPVVTPEVKEEEKPTTDNKWVLTAFQLSLLVGFQQMAGNSRGAAELSWNPTYFFNSAIGLRGNFAGLLYKPFPGKAFAALDYELLFFYFFSPKISVELGGGAQTWINQPQSTQAIASANFVWNQNKPPLSGTTDAIRFIDRIALGYSLLLAPNAIHLIRLALGFRF